MRFVSPTYGVCEGSAQIVDKIFKKILTKEHSEWIIAIGTDSQNKQSKTKFCSAILLLEKGSGGTYFYSVHEEKRIPFIQNRMLKEAQLSIELGKEIIDEIENKQLEEFYEREMNISFEIHCDLGHEGKSRDSISAAIGWIAAEFGNTVTTRIKPESTAASCIADKYTK